MKKISIFLVFCFCVFNSYANDLVKYRDFEVDDSVFVLQAQKDIVDFSETVRELDLNSLDYDNPLVMTMYYQPSKDQKKLKTVTILFYNKKGYGENFLVIYQINKQDKIVDVLRRSYGSSVPRDLWGVVDEAYHFF